jgi:hypothetical protein
MVRPTRVLAYLRPCGLDTGAKGMKMHNTRLIVAAALLLVTGSVLANEVIEVWGYGISPQAATSDARSLGRQACLDQGYSFSSFEEVQNYNSGGGYVSYGLANCF